MFINSREIPIEKCKIFENICEEKLAEAFKKIHFQIKTYQANEPVLTGNAKCNNLMIILQGTVKTELSDMKGATIHIADIKEKGTLAPAFLFGKTNFLPVDIIAKTNVEILFIPKNEVYKLFKFCPGFLTNFLNLISERTQFLVHKIQFLSFNTIKGKMAFYLLKNSKEQNSDIIKLKETQNELAENFCVTRTSVARVLSQLKEEKTIKVKGKTIEITDKQKLSAYLKYRNQFQFK